ncbi:Na/Pi cotransporter family protein [Staphylococcus massiliensis]|uniref:Na/Pi cotransporter family protein n=1 Tax=Staphylococcus massiliensis S46 TaxID=1229783 RepID=K9AUL4_9STAP|nr:Na/Pi cotransporter family protein [Staphylococcus massiliensis]EKU45175.1 Na/Pi cotransporter family protein [Staphylococcus massiliensis S46]MCG3402387.1 Na/Pi cotransporter family protein [Staphylococcus massiliensis]PNZ99357.1 Na/Pi cotransporter family protein [Staphylococcus massiliensis CCUG 55927]
MELSVTETIFTFLGGLGIFLFGLKQMGDGLQSAAGDRLRNILNIFTSNPVLGVLAGMLVTILIQSSSGTTAITIGLVSAGFMTLRQAIGVIMGANIGTTVTAFLIGIKLEDYALPLIALGALLIFFFAKRKVNNIGRIIFGFGSLFYGLKLMGDAVKPLAKLDGFKDLMLSMSDHPLLGVAVGTGLTALVQSSSATIGILQKFFESGMLDIHAAIPVLFGDNIGTTITAVLAALAGSLAAKRAAAVHVLFNLIGVFLFMLILPLFTMFMQWVQKILHLSPELTIAFAHGTFNVTNTIIQLPFVFALAWLVTKIIPGKDVTEAYQPKHLDRNLAYRAPGMALQQSQKEVQNMGMLVGSILDDLSTKDPAKEKDIVQKYQAVDTIGDSIRHYLVRISTRDLSTTDGERLSVMFDINKSILQVNELAREYLEQRRRQKRNNIKITDDAQRGVDRLFDHVKYSYKKAIDTIDVYDDVERDEVVQRSKEAYDLEHDLRRNHIRRLNRGECSTDGGLLYVDTITVIERIGYNSRNISESVMVLEDTPEPTDEEVKEVQEQESK